MTDRCFGPAASQPNTLERQQRPSQQQNPSGVLHSTKSVPRLALDSRQCIPIAFPVDGPPQPTLDLPTPSSDAPAQNAGAPPSRPPWKLGMPLMNSPDTDAGPRSGPGPKGLVGVTSDIRSLVGWMRASGGYVESASRRTCPLAEQASDQARRQTPAEAARGNRRKPPSGVVVRVRGLPSLISASARVPVQRGNPPRSRHQTPPEIPPLPGDEIGRRAPRAPQGAGPASGFAGDGVQNAPFQPPQLPSKADSRPPFQGPSRPPSETGLVPAAAVVAGLNRGCSLARTVAADAAVGRGRAAVVAAETAVMGGSAFPGGTVWDVPNGDQEDSQVPACLCISLESGRMGIVVLGLTGVLCMLRA